MAGGGQGGWYDRPSAWAPPGAPVGVVPAAPPGWGAPPPPRRRRRPPAVLLVALVVALGVGGGWAAGQVVGGGPEAVVEVPAAGPHTFTTMAGDGVTPVGYDPCRPISYVLRTEHLPAGGAELVHSAVARISEVTGLDFDYAGTTDDAPGDDRLLRVPDGRGADWAPVLIAFETPAENPDFDGSVIGQAGSAVARVTSSLEVYVTGQVRLDAEWFAERIDSDRAGARAVVLHELGHLVGLGHVDDSSQLMNESYVGVVDFQGGDLAGLAALGRGACASDR